MKIRWPVFIGQLIFVVVGIISIIIGLSIRVTLWYKGPPPVIYILSGFLLVGVAIILSILHKKS